MAKKQLQADYVVTPTTSNKQLDANYYVEASFNPPPDNYTPETNKNWYPKIKPGAFWV